MAKPVSWVVVGLAALCAALLGYWVAQHVEAPGVQLTKGTWLAQPRGIADFRLLDGQGHSFSLQNLRGRATLVFFGFTHCPDVCPTTLAKLAQIKKLLGRDGPALQVVFVTVDPQRDTPEAVRSYAHAFDPEFVGVTGHQKVLDKVMASFGVASMRVDLPGGDYTMDHSAAVFLLDTHARIAGVFTPPFDVNGIAQDLRIAAPYLSRS